MARLVQRCIGNHCTVVNNCIFRSEHPLAHKRAMLNTLLQRADKLCDQQSERQESIDLVRSTFKHSSYPHRLLYRKKPVNKTKNE